MKDLTLDNWLEPDPLTSAFSNVYDLTTGETTQISVEEFLSYILEPRLSEAVPQNVRTLFEGARGAMCYGYYFYPLFMVGAEQLFRVTEAVVRHQAEQLQPPKRSTFNENVQFLVERGVIHEADKDRWDGFRALRNQASHPKSQQVGPPGPTVGMLAEIADVINQLFTESSSADSLD